MKRPLLSLVLFTYNQEKYIEEAVEGALAQTYQPLEIIISDDCSTDRTFEIIQRVVGNYAGAHKIILNRNEHNLGLSRNLEKAVSLANGELFIAAEGDDVSLPGRVSAIYEHWYPVKDKVYALFSSNITINKDGSPARVPNHPIYEDHIESDILSVGAFLGACGAYSPRLFKQFGEMEKESLEDIVLFRRALFLGKVYFIKEPLVKYRLAGLCSKIYDFAPVDEIINRVKRIACLRYGAAKQNLADLVRAGIKDEGIIGEFRKYYSSCRLQNCFHTANGLRKLIYLMRLVPYIGRKCLRVLTVREYLKLIVVLFPGLLGVLMKLREAVHSRSDGQMQKIQDGSPRHFVPRDDG